MQAGASAHHGGGASTRGDGHGDGLSPSGHGIERDGQRRANRECAVKVTGAVQGSGLRDRCASRREVGMRKRVCENARAADTCHYSCRGPL